MFGHLILRVVGRLRSETVVSGPQPRRVNFAISTQGEVAEEDDYDDIIGSVCITLHKGWGSSCAIATSKQCRISSGRSCKNFSCCARLDFEVLGLGEGRMTTNITAPYFVRWKAWKGEAGLARGQSLERTAEDDAVSGPLVG